MILNTSSQNVILKQGFKKTGKSKD